MKVATWTPHLWLFFLYHSSWCDKAKIKLQELKQSYVLNVLDEFSSWAAGGKGPAVTGPLQLGLWRDDWLVRVGFAHLLSLSAVQNLF